MKVKATYLQNDKANPIVFGEANIYNTSRKKTRSEKPKKGLLCEPVIAGFCGSDNAMLQLGKKLQLKSQFPKGKKRLINGHEGVVYIPEQKRFGIVLIRGGDSYDPTRFMDDESFFEYGCEGADGQMCEKNYFNPEMLLEIPKKHLKGDKISLSLAKKLVFSDPCACMFFQLERLEDLGSAHNFRLEMAINKCSEEKGRTLARKNIFKKVVIFGLGTTGMIMSDLIKQKYPESKLVLVARSDPKSKKVENVIKKTGASYVQNNYENNADLATAIREELNGKASLFIATSGTDLDHKIAFEEGVLGNNGIYDSFSLGPTLTINALDFGYKNQLMYCSINFREEHMKKAINYLCETDYDQFVEVMPQEKLGKNPKAAYKKIYGRNSAMKTITIWNPQHLNLDK